MDVAAIGGVSRIVGDGRTVGGGPATRVVRTPAVGLGVGDASAGPGVRSVGCCVGESARVGSARDDSPLDGVVDDCFNAPGANASTRPAASTLAAALSTSVLDDAARTMIDRTRRTFTSRPIVPSHRKPTLGTSERASRPRLRRQAVLSSDGRCLQGMLRQSWSPHHLGTRSAALRCTRLISVGDVHAFRLRTQVDQVLPWRSPRPLGTRL